MAPPRLSLARRVHPLTGDKEVDPGGDAPARIIPSVPDGAVQAGGMIGSHQSGNAVTRMLYMLISTGPAAATV